MCVIANFVKKEEEKEGGVNKVTWVFSRILNIYR